MLCTCEKDNTEVRAFNDLLFGYSPFHCQRLGSSWELELKFLSVSWHFRRCFELNHRIVLERSMKGHRSPFMVSYGIVYKIKLRWRSNNSSTLHTEETLITCCFKETKKKSKNNWQSGSLELGLLHLLFNHCSKGAAGTNSRYFIGFFMEFPKRKLKRNLPVRVIAVEIVYSLKTRRRFWSCNMCSSSFLSFDKFHHHYRLLW